MGTHPIFESDFDCLTVLEKKMSSAEAEISTVAGHPKAQTVGGMRVVGKTPHETKPTVTEPDEGATGGAVQTQKSDQLIIAGAPVDEKKDYPTEALKHMQQKPLPTKEPKHVLQNSQQNRNIHQPR